ncbi:DnaJ domain-containing protein [Loa loa]|uniref:DnaJ domain-containing protein n=1 Tax=Loa loa TaxID=7209 RepID=A0A1I7VVV1_LOALO|nr:DnaJ domain-containing protein [Loa loa]EFO28214.1 DnaJ domain-containing protein [Loa loa]
MVSSSDLDESGWQEDGRPNSKQKKTKGPSLYEILGITEDASDDDIKRAYRKLALKYHPDKNLENDPEKTERFKEINHAHAVLSVPTRRKVYDKYGDMGLKLMEQFSDDGAVIGLAFKPWFKWTFIICGLSTCCCFFCCCGCMFCCNCCCNFCCGKYKPKGFDEEGDIGESDAEQETNGTVSVIVDQPEESNMLPKSSKDDENLKIAESSNEKLRDYPTSYSINHISSEADPEN